MKSKKKNNKKSNEDMSKLKPLQDLGQINFCKTDKNMNKHGGHNCTCHEDIQEQAFKYYNPEVSEATDKEKELLGLKHTCEYDSDGGGCKFCGLTASENLFKLKCLNENYYDAEIKKEITIKVKKLSDKAKIPVRAHKGDCGLDLFAAEEKIICPGERELIKTDIAMKIPSCHYGRICDRSGLALKNGITILGGQIDEGYLGNIGVILFNSNFGIFSPDTHNYVTSRERNIFKVNIGDKIAQIVIEKYYDFPIEEVDNLEETERGTGGFGSTDKK